MTAPCAGVLLLLGLLTQIAQPVTPTQLPTEAGPGTYLGVLFAPVTSGNFSANTPVPALVPIGVVVTQVLPNSPADRAGLRRNDLLRSYSGERVTSCEQLAKLIQSDTPGKVVKLEVLRGTSAHTLEARLTTGPALRLMGESRPTTDPSPAVSKPAAPALSAQIEPLPDGRLRVDLQYYREGTGRLASRTLTGSLVELQKEIATFSEAERRLAQVLLDRLKKLELSPAAPRP